MAPFDVPHVSHDMILRFMGVNFSAITEGSAKLPSSVGNDVKPVFDGNKPISTAAPGSDATPQQDKAMWEGQLNLFGYLTLSISNVGCQHITTRDRLR